MQTDLTHTGTLDVISGTLDLRGNHLLSAPLSVDAGAVLRLAGSNVATFADGSSVIGDGTFEQSGTVIDIPNGVRVPINNYTTPSGSGRVTGTGTLVIANSTTLTRVDHQDAGTTEIPSGVSVAAGDSSFRISGGRTLHVIGNLSLPDSFNSTSNDGAQIENDGQIDFDDSCTINHGGGVFSIRNDGVIRCNAPGTSNVSLPPDSYSGNGSNDQLIVSSILDLGGMTIEPSLVSGYNPTPGTSWDIVTAGSFSGAVAMVDQSNASPGFGFFLSTVGSQLRLTYTAIDSFQKAYEAATGTSLGPNPDLSAIAEGDIDNDGRPDLLDWAFGGTLTGPDPGRELIIDSVVSIAGNMRRSSLRYPTNPLATDVVLSWETNTTLDTPFSSVIFTPTGTATYDGILFQEGTADTLASPSASFFRLRAELP